MAEDGAVRKSAKGHDVGNDLDFVSGFFKRIAADNTNFGAFVSQPPVVNITRHVVGPAWCHSVNQALSGAGSHFMEGQFQFIDMYGQIRHAQDLSNPCRALSQEIAESPPIGDLLYQCKGRFCIAPAQFPILLLFRDR